MSIKLLQDITIYSSFITLQHLMNVHIPCEHFNVILSAEKRNCQHKICFSFLPLENINLLQREVIVYDSNSNRQRSDAKIMALVCSRLT